MQTTILDRRRWRFIATLMSLTACSSSREPSESVSSQEQAGAGESAATPDNTGERAASPSVSGGSRAVGASGASGASGHGGSRAASPSASGGMRAVEPSDSADAAAAMTKQLTDNAAGKACTAQNDCGNGECRQEFPSGAWGTASGSQSAPGGYCSLPCNLNSECGQGGVCAYAAGQFWARTAIGFCMARCEASRDCREGYHCVDASGVIVDATMNMGPTAGSCQVTPETDKLSGQTAGAMCAMNGDCGSGMCVTTDALGTTYPGGYCSGRCSTDADCGEQAACGLGPSGSTVGACYRTCKADADCGRAGYRCRSADAATKLCVPGVGPLPDQKAGSPCTSDADCGGAAYSCTMQLTSGDVQRTAPGGYCSLYCVDDADCGAGGSCVGGPGSGATASGICYKLCSAATDCRDGYTCGSLSSAADADAGAQAQSSARPVCYLTPTTTNTDAGTP